MKTRAEQLAERMHEIGRALAVEYIPAVADGTISGYPAWADVPEEQRALAVAAMAQVLPEFTNLTPPAEPGCRRFVLRRAEDETGMSGTGDVAEGLEFRDGHVAMRWTTEVASTTFYDSVGDVELIHGHGGRTRVVFVDVAEGDAATVSGDTPRR